jgi:hypothetical protein
VYLRDLVSDTVKPGYNDHSRDLEFVAVVDMWSVVQRSVYVTKIDIGTQK